jgi:hypothetical protein
MIFEMKFNLTHPELDTFGPWIWCWDTIGACGNIIRCVGPRIPLSLILENMGFEDDAAADVE